MCSAPCGPSTAPTAGAACACRRTASAPYALPAVPGVSSDTARAQWRERGAAAPGRLAEASSLPAARVPPRHQPPSRFPRQPVARAKATLSKSADTARPCSSTSRPGSAARCLPGRPAEQPRRGVPAPARHSAGASAAAGRGLPGAGHLAARGARLARRAHGGSPHHARWSPRRNLYGRAVGTVKQDAPRRSGTITCLARRGTAMRLGLQAGRWPTVGLRVPSMRLALLATGGCPGW